MRSLCLISLCLFLSLGLTEGLSLHPDTYLNITQLIQRYGYPVETHEVITEDGYKLTMFRIPHGRRGYGVNKKPILLMHGLYGQSENYVVAGMDNASMAYYLADNNYDVWLGNTRGTQHSRKHKYIDPDRKKFWEFSWHEIGMYDLPAKIDHILETTKKKKIYYVGHSQGGTSFYIMSSERPEYQKKIILASLMAPAGFMEHFRNPVLFPLVAMYRGVLRIADTLLYELPPRSIPLPTFLNLICQERFLNDLCLAIYHVIINGGDSGEFNRRMLPLIMRFIPTVSVRQPLHYAQSIMSGRFRRWDYGQENNMARYRRSEPPDYSLRNITVPIAIFYSYGDNLVYAKDIDHICDVLPNVVKKHLMRNPKWTHLDFIFAKNGQKQLHEPLLTLMEKFK